MRKWGNTNSLNVTVSTNLAEVLQMPRCMLEGWMRKWGNTNSLTVTVSS